MTLEDIYQRIVSRRKNAERQKRNAKYLETRLRNEGKAKALKDIEWWLYQMIAAAD